MFISWCNVLEGHEEPLSVKMNRDFKLTFTITYLYWVPVSFFTFYCVPLRLRSLCACVANFFDDIFHTYASHNNVKQAIHSLTS